MEEKNKSIFKNAIFKLLLNIFNLVVPLLVGPYVARVLGADLMGTVNFAQSIYGYFYIFAGFGVYQYGLREISKIRNNKEKVEKTFSNLFLITVLASVVTTILYTVLIQYKYSNDNIMYIVCMIYSFNLLSNVFYAEWINEALENYDFITIKTIAVRILYILFIFISVHIANDIYIYVWILAISNLLNNIISFIYIKRKIRFDFSELTLFKHIRPMFLVVILSNANVLYTQLDKILLGEYINMESVGYYSVSQNISSMINMLLLTVVHVGIPRLNNVLSESDESVYEALLNKIAKIYFLIVFPAAVGLALLSKEAILIYGGKDYIDATEIMVVFSLFLIVLGYEAILSNQIMYIKGKEKQLVKMVFIGGVINLILNIILIKLNMFNGLSAIVTTFIAMSIQIFIEYIYIKYKLKVKFNIFSLDKSKYLFISLIFIPITLIIKSFALNIILTCLLTVGINFIIYVLILFLSKDSNFNLLLSKLINLLKKYKEINK